MVRAAREGDEVGSTPPGSRGTLQMRLAHLGGRGVPETRRALGALAQSRQSRGLVSRKIPVRNPGSTSNPPGGTVLQRRGGKAAWHRAPASPQVIPSHYPRDPGWTPGPAPVGSSSAQDAGMCDSRAFSSLGRAPRLQRGGSRFDPGKVHHHPGRGSWPFPSARHRRSPTVIERGGPGFPILVRLQWRLPKGATSQGLTSRGGAFIY